MHTEIPWNLIAPLLVIHLILAVVGLISLYKAESTRGPKWMWVIVILLGNLIGTVAYFVVGRKETS
ncbi:MULTISPECIES: PLD nuclease N-terminal domain-containing protein [Paenibacillus]|uniref:Negative regulatory protein YxlE n=1 Tax=Paenibacillus azoreducens TaxID=116718 RepID=A0A919YA55_9BACL|nr:MULTISPECIES: PLD nuclease N-terminal domain-containing protein [Paenibacillus]MBE9916041.1 PLDc_N domain-containing protein [Paenibacillus donghaensis]GIO46649.1 negative regulatory protein YxlE [Paenibacillus azoreducens]